MTLAVQVLVLLAALLGRWIPLLPLRICRYYLLVTFSIALGFWDRWRQGRPATGRRPREPGEPRARRPRSRRPMVLTAPLMLVSVILIHVEGGGKAIYRQTRVGLHGTEFEMLKLRTMVHGV